jgi:hypothetical protein
MAERTSSPAKEAGPPARLPVQPLIHRNAQSEPETADQIARSRTGTAEPEQDMAGTARDSAPAAMMAQSQKSTPF